MNNWIQILQLKTKKDINEFIYDFIDPRKIKTNVVIDDFVEHFKLDSNKLVNKFISDFSDNKEVNKLFTARTQAEWECNLGLTPFFQEHDRWMKKLELYRLTREFKIKLN